MKFIARGDHLKAINENDLIVNSVTFDKIYKLFFTLLDDNTTGRLVCFWQPPHYQVQQTHR